MSTVGDLARGDIDQFVPGLFFSGLMVWWSVSVRNRRKRKLAGDLPAKRAKSQKDSKNSAQVVGPVRTGADSKDAGSADPTGLDHVQVVEENGNSASTDLPANSQAANSSTPEGSAIDAATSDPDPTPELLVDESSTHDATGVGFTTDDVDGAGSAEETSQFDRPNWRDGQGRELHVGAKVSFLANSRGQSVSIPGVLLGERDGKALIEVGSGAMLPKNDYAIPWNVVSLTD